MSDTGLSQKRIKAIFSDRVVQTIVITFLTMLVTLGIIFAVLWHYRARVFQVLATGYSSSLKPAASNLVYDPLLKQNVVLPQAPLSASSVAAPVASQGTVVDAVKKAQPAVVSITISKQVPKYKVVNNPDSQNVDPNDPFGGMFPGFFQTPVYQQDGTENKDIGGGSGFLISSDGMIVTNKHVVADSSATYTVSLNNGKKYTATVLAKDPVLDVALIKISVTGLPYLTLGNSDSLDVGQSVIAIGNALGQFKNSVSVGVVSGLSRSITAGDNAGSSEHLDKVIQTDAAINPGNSGGPLLNLNGEVIGINVAVVQGSSNVGFALPINNVKSAINSVKATGKIIRPYIGIRYVPVTVDLKAKNNLSVDYGILVARGSSSTDLAVIPGSPANKAGILENDIILSVDGQKIDQDNDFAAIIRNKTVGSYISLTILSKGLQKTVTIKLEAAPDNG